MFIKEYAVCPICGGLTDDGTIIHTKDKYYLVCFDCSESIPKWMIQQTIERMETDESIRRSY